MTLVAARWLTLWFALWTQPPSTPSTVPPEAPNDAASTWIEVGGPSLAQCQRAAVARAMLAPQRARRWLRDARRAAALPQVDGTYERRRGRGWQLDREVGSADQLTDDHDADELVRVRLSWRLDRAWFNPDELRAARAAADLERLRRELLLEVTALYFDRIRAWSAVAQSADPMDRVQARLEAQQLDAMLAALTGLHFDHDPTRPRPSAAAKAPGSGSM